MQTETTEEDWFKAGKCGLGGCKVVLNKKSKVKEHCWNVHTTRVPLPLTTIITLSNTTTTGATTGTITRTSTSQSTSKKPPKRSCNLCNDDGFVYGSCLKHFKSKHIRAKSECEFCGRRFTRTDAKNSHIKNGCPGLRKDVDDGLEDGMRERKAKRQKTGKSGN